MHCGDRSNSDADNKLRSVGLLSAIVFVCIHCLPCACVNISIYCDMVLVWILVSCKIKTVMVSCRALKFLILIVVLYKSDSTCTSLHILYLLGK